MKPRLQRSVIKAGYQLLSARSRGVTTFMNYGYAPPGPARLDIVVPASDDMVRNCAQLYFHVARAADLGGKDVLEVGSGRGGGSAFIMAQFGPKSVTGVDFASRAVSFCNSNFHVDSLTFVKGDAENLPFADHSFDIVVNIESSHCYPSVPRFLSQVGRVLRPHGYLLFADLRLRKDIAVLREQFLEAGLEIVEEEDITEGVVRALEIDNAWRSAMIERSIPSPLRNASREFCAVKGSRVHEQLCTGELQYLRCVLRSAEHRSILGKALDSNEARSEQATISETK